MLREMGESTVALEAALSQYDGLECFVKNAGDRLPEIQKRFDAMPELQRNSCQVQNLIQTELDLLKTMNHSMEILLDRVGMYVCLGCPDVVEIYGDINLGLPEKPAAENIRDSLYELRNTVVRTQNYCENAASTIGKFVYVFDNRRSRRVIKNLAHILTGQPLIDAGTENRRIVRLFSAPFLAEKSCLSEFQAAVEQNISNLELLGQGKDDSQKERPSLADKLAKAKGRVQPPVTKSPGDRGVELV
jgi:hypothetical protein